MSEALNAEAVLASIVELRERIEAQNKRMDERIEAQNKRTDERIEAQNKRTDERIEAQNKRTDERIEAQNKRTDERFEEQGKRIDKLCEAMEQNNSRLSENTRIVGLLTNKLGGIVERIVIPGIVDKFNEKGFKFDSVSANVEFLNDKKDGNIAEVDALLENGKFVIAVETKTELSVKDVNAHVKRLQALRNVPRFKGKKIYGAFSTAISKKRPINYALEQGFYVLQQPDVVAVSILDFPKGRSAKAW